jgi:hypothetical protein
MVGTIVPVGNGQAAAERNQILRWYATGLVVGGSITGALLGVSGEILRLASPSLSLQNDWTRIACGMFLVVTSFGEAGIIKLPIPAQTYKVPKSWFYTLGYRRGTLSYGLALGCGFVTQIASHGFYGVAALALFMPEVKCSVLLMAGFAIGRLVPVLLVRRVTSSSGCDIGILATAAQPLRSALVVLNAMMLSCLGAFLCTQA